LISKALTSTGINKQQLDRVKSREFVCPRVKNIYQAPLMIIAEMETLNSGLWQDGFLAYTHEFIGIKTQLDEKAELRSFYKWFKNNNDILRSYLQLCSGRMLTARATATQKKDIMNLPYPDNGDFDLTPWEVELLDDIRNYMAEYVRLGQDSQLLVKRALDQDLLNYSQTFLRLMNKIYPNMKKSKEMSNSDFRLIAFSFSNSSDLLPELDNSNWLETLSTLINNNEKYYLQTKRIIKIYTGDILIILKPNKLRYWIRSTAIRDVDDVIDYIFKREK
jgi:hypothetical protein